MREPVSGDVVLLHQANGLSQLCIIVNSISPTEVQLTYLDASSFDATTAPIYQRGSLPGQWEPTNETVPEDVRRMSESFRMTNHPAARGLHALLTLKLSPDIEDAFSEVGRSYAEKDVHGPFYEVRHRREPFNNDDYFYNLLMMGVQEGLRSTLYFLQRFLALAEVVKTHGAAIIADVKPSHMGTLGINPGVLNAEYEGFILLSRATIDRLTYFLKYYFQIKNNDPSIYKLLQHLQKTHEFDNRSQRLIKVVDRHRVYLDTQLIGQGQPVERNRVAHQEYLGFAWPNIMYNQDGMVRVAFVYGENLEADATEELPRRFHALKLFILDLLRDFFSEERKEDV